MSLSIDFVQSRDFPQLDLKDINEEHVYFVPKKLYDRDLLDFMPGDTCRHQFSKDFRRCDFVIDGEITRGFTNVHTSLLPYCTQTVMGIPVTILSASSLNCIVSECTPPQRMHVELWNDQIVFVQKVLVVHSAQTKTIGVTIKVDMADANVELRFVLLDLKSFDLNTT